ncbi:hypothetical protein [Avibacterium sp. 21-599]|nr:hypothetical protein [Avibacterium sp. 21-599]MCW9717582.1 hypothetical protein [Avibacterium sp. 21-599]
MGKLVVNQSVHKTLQGFGIHLVIVPKWKNSKDNKHSTSNDKKLIIHYTQ